MEASGPSHDDDINADLIGSATSIEEIIDALSRRGCSNLTSSIDSTAFSELPCAGGGFCDVYQGALDNGTKIAIKALRIYGESDKRKLLKRAARELYHWSKLKHCNVLPLMGLTVFRGHISMVSEWVDNGNLMTYLKRTPDANRIKLCMDICAGLCYIHTNDMVHGDLKAANVMVSSDGAALIADFGNAELRDLTLRFTNTTSVGLSFRWAAPELFKLVANRGSRSRVSKEADVYAFGMTVLETLTGKVPFEGTKEYQLIALVGYGGKLPPRPDVGMHDDLWDVLNCCWAREPAERPVITTLKDHLQTLFRPPFETGSVADTTPQFQISKFNPRQRPDTEDVLHSAYRRSLQNARKRAAGEDDEEEVGKSIKRYIRPRLDDQNDQHYSDEEEHESESEGEDVFLPRQSVQNDFSEQNASNNMDRRAHNLAGFQFMDDLGHGFPNFNSGFNPLNLSDNSPALAHTHPGMHNPSLDSTTISRPLLTPPERTGRPGRPGLGMNHGLLAGTGELPPLPKLAPGIPTGMHPGMSMSQSPFMTHPLPPGQQIGHGTKHNFAQPEQGPGVGGPSGAPLGSHIRNMHGGPTSPNTRLKPPPAGTRKKAKTNTTG